MKTILVVYTNEKLTVEQINSRKMKKYCFRIDGEIAVGDVLKSKTYSTNMVVTDILDTDYKYYNNQTGDLSNEITSTMCYLIKTIVIRTEEEDVIYATKVANEKV